MTSVPPWPRAASSTPALHVRMRLWTPHDAGRPRRFYERERWTTTGSARADSPLVLPIVEYERRLDVDGRGFYSAEQPPAPTSQEEGAAGPPPSAS